MNLKIVVVFVFVFVMPSFSWARSAPNDVIGAERAKEIAIKIQPGTIKSDELEFEKGMWIYSYDIMGSDSKIHEVQVNARTGKIVGNTVESAEQEATEKD